MGLGRQQRGRNDAGIVGGCWVAELEYGEGADAPCPVASRPGGHVVDGEPAMSRFAEAWVIEDECALAWVVDGEVGVVDGGRDAVEIAHLAAAGVFVLELARMATPSPSPASPSPPLPTPMPSFFCRLPGLSDPELARTETPSPYPASSPLPPWRRWPTTPSSSLASPHRPPRHPPGGLHIEQ